MSNPFSAQAIRPGAIPYQFADDDSAERFCGRLLADHRGRGAIIGPHGSGKSTLLCAVQTAWSKIFASDPTRTLIAIDGFEQIRPWNRALIVLKARLRNQPLLVTAHRPILGLGVAHRTLVTEARVRSIIGYCLRNQVDLIPQFESLALKMWPDFSGNLRELLFAMYDHYEDLRPTLESPSI